MNFKNMAPDGVNDVGRMPSGNFSLARQTSIYSLTFDEFQSTLGGPGKDFGSMNMDEFLKNIWTAEETQAMASAAFGNSEGGGGTGAGGSLQRQGSLTLPRTISQKTVDEVWRDVFRESGGRDGGGNSAAPNLQRQPTLGEITLEEFLVRAGVVREDPQAAARPNNGGFYGELLNLSNNMGLGLAFPDRPNEIGSSRVPADNHNQIPNQPQNLPINMNGVRSSHQERQPQQPQQQQQIYPKQPTMGFAPSMQFTSNADAGNPVIKNGIMGIGDPAACNGFVHGGGGGGGMGMVGLGPGGVTVAIESPSPLSSDGLGKSNGDTSSLSPAPYVFNGGLRGRRSGAVEKVVERRQRRMIKNRESAARSRARKQAYTMELEAEVAKLKEENKELERKQELIMEMQKSQVLEMINQQTGPKRRCLRRTQTGPW